MDYLIGLSGYLYVIFLWLAIVFLFLFICVVIHSIFTKKIDDEEIGAMLVFFLFMVVFGLSAYGLSGPAGKKPYLKQKCNAIVNFINPFKKSELSHLDVESTELESGQLKMKLLEVKDTRLELSEKKERAENLISYYQNGIAEVRREILITKRQKKIDDFAQARSDQEIINALTLIQRRKAYIAELENVIRTLVEAINELDFLEKTTKDDLMMGMVFNKEELDKLRKKIDQVIAKYDFSARDLVINIDPEKQIPLDQIWEEINQ